MSLPPIAALEIGTTKVRVLVGEMREDGQFMITGLGEVPSRGIRKAEVVDFDVALSCVRSAIQQAEDHGHVTIHQLHLVVSGGHIQAFVNRGTVPVEDPNREITRDDMEHAMTTARAVNLTQERVALHTICQRFYVDDQHGVVNPESMEGSRLSVDMLILHGVRGRLRNTVKVVRTTPMDVQDVAFGGLCSALAVLTPQQKERGCVVIDLGGGTTDYVVYARNAISLAGSISVGGDHISNDIATGLRMSVAQAEQMKEKFGNAMADMSSRGKKVAVPTEVGGGERFVLVSDLNTIVHVRMEETLTMIRHELEREGLLPLLGAGVVLAGGGARLTNVETLVSKVFRLPCEVGRPRNVSGLQVVTEGPEFAAAVGMVRYGFSTMQRGGGTASLKSLFRSIFGGRG